MRAKIIDGELVLAPRKINREIEGEPYVTYNPTDEMLAAQGWLPVVETDPPDDPPEGYHYEPTYTEESGEIVQGWELAEDGDIPDSEALEIIMGGGGE